MKQILVIVLVMMVALAAFGVYKVLTKPSEDQLSGITLCSGSHHQC
jgi:hypothetical protein